MKLKIFLIVNFLFFFYNSNSQVVTKTLKTVNVVPTRDFYLNGEARSTFGTGVQYHVVTVELPENTVEWHYALSTTSNENQQASINLTSQLARIIDRTGLTSLAINSLFTPQGRHTCNVFLLADANSGRSFFNGQSNWRHYTKYGAMGIANGVISIREKGFFTQGTWYIGFKNPTITQGMNITVEVTAIVEESNVDNSVWEKTKIDQFYNLILPVFKKQFGDEKGQNFADCFVDKFTQKFKPEDFQSMPEYKMRNLMIEFGKECGIE